MDNDCNSELLLALKENLKTIYPNQNEDLEKIINTTKEILSKYKIIKENDNKTSYSIKDNIKLYISIKRFEGLSEITLYNYELQLNKFNKYIKKDISNINSMNIRLYLSQLTKIKNTSVNCAIWTLKSFFKWIAEERILTDNPMIKIKIIKTDKILREPLNYVDIEKLRDACNTIRKRAILEFLLATGLRLSECISINRDMINKETKSIKVIGKGRKEREVYFSDRAEYHLQKYINSRIDDNPPLFVSSKFPYHRLGGRSIESEVHNIYNDSGVINPVFPHKFRSTMASNSINCGMDITSVQKILGHSDIKTTLIYAQKNSDIIKGEYLKFMNT